MTPERRELYAEESHISYSLSNCFTTPYVVIMLDLVALLIRLDNIMGNV